MSAYWGRFLEKKLPNRMKKCILLNVGKNKVFFSKGVGFWQKNRQQLEGEKCQVILLKEEKG